MDTPDRPSIRALKYTRGEIEKAISLLEDELSDIDYAIGLIRAAEAKRDIDWPE